MATSLAPAQRRKVTTYGKVARKPAYDLFADDATPPRIKPQSLVVRQASKAGDSTVKAQDPPKKATGKLVAPSPKKGPGIFDVPSDDDENDPFRFPALKPSPPLPKLTPRAASQRPEKSGISVVQRRRVVEVPVERLRKRKRDASETGSPPVEAAMVSVQESRSETVGHGVQEEIRLPRSDMDRIAPQPQPSIGQNQLKRARKAKGPVTLPQRPVLKGLSAPAVLTRMFQETSTRRGVNPINAPEVGGNAADATELLDMTVELLPSTPPSAPRHSPASAPQSGAVTPRQKELWNRLLESPESRETPSSLRLADLNLSRNATRRIRRVTGMTAPTLHNRPSRLVDTLKVLASVDDESSSEEELTESDSPSDREDRVSLQRTETDPMSTQDSQTMSKPTKATYALESRTYLEDKNEDDIFDLLGQEIGESAGVTAESRTHIDEGLDDEEDSQSKQPRSVHDLRAAGARRRLLDGLESLVDEISAQGPKTLSPKRSSLIELALKLFQKDAVICFLDCGLDRKLLEYASSTSDIVCNFAVAVILCLVAEESTRPSTLRDIHQSNYFRSVMALLQNDMDISRIAKERKTNMSRIAQSSVMDFRTEVAGSSLWPAEPKTVSPRLVALKLLDLIVRGMREAGSREALLDDQLVASLLSILDEHSQIAEDNSHPDLLQSTLGFSVLMSSSSFDQVSNKRPTWKIEHLKTLSKILPPFLAETGPRPEELQPLALKLCINVANKDRRSCDALASQSLLQSLLQSINERFRLLETGIHGDERSLTFDRLILSLGALLNLTEFSSDARSSVRSSYPAGVKDAVQHFLYGQERAQDAESLQAAETNIPYGWLAVVLGNLCQEFAIREFVRAEMPGGTLRPLIVAVDTFIKIFQRTTLQELEGDEGQIVANDFVERMRSIPERLREVEGV